jgi:hypothetical protein
VWKAKARLQKNDAIRLIKQRAFVLPVHKAVLKGVWIMMWCSLVVGK